MPIVYILAFGVLRSTGAGPPLPQIALGQAMFFCAASFVGAIGEEMGWQGYVYADLRARWSAPGAALVVDVFWALWHVIPFAQLGRGADWILWHSLGADHPRLAVREQGRERFRRGAVSHHDQPLLGALSERRLILRPVRHFPDPSGRGWIDRLPVGTGEPGSVSLWLSKRTPHRS